MRRGALGRGRGGRATLLLVLVSLLGTAAPARAIDIAITALTAGESVVVSGQTSIAVSVDVSNLSSRTVNALGGTLSFKSLGFLELTTQYAVTALGSNPTSVSATSTVRLTFSVDANLSASTGTVLVAAELTGNDAGTGDPVHISGSGEPVVFGGRISASGRMNDTWELDSASWYERSPSTAPVRRILHEVSYDPVRSRQYLFGGRDANELADTWSWDGVTWAELTPASSPDARGEAGMAHDTFRGRTVLFGGTDFPIEFGDTWEFDGTAWELQSPATAPSPRNGHAMAYDSARRRVVLFGGEAADPQAETWEWDGTSWEMRLPATSPPESTRHGLAYDAARGVTVFFGGGNPDIKSGETWEWDGTSWEQKLPATSPEERRNLGMTYDFTRERVVLFGGNASDLEDDTWEWDGTVWTLLAPATAPEARHEHSMEMFQRTTAWSVLGAPELSILDIVPVPATVVQGQTGVQLTMSVANLGGTSATLTASGLDFSTVAGAADVTGQYTQSALATNPASIGVGQTVLLTFTVDVGASATPGDIALDGTVAGVESSSGVAVSDTDADPGGTLTVITPARFELTGFTAPAQASRGGSFTATVSVRNAGESTGDVTATTLVWSGTGLTATAQGAALTSLAGGASAQLGYSVSVALTTPLTSSPETFAASAAVAGLDAVVGTDATTSDAAAGTIEVLNNPPTANAGTDLTGTVTAAVTFDGSASFDGPFAGQSEGDPLTYTWSIVSRPAGSSVTAASFSTNGAADASAPQLTADRKGSYVVGLVVHDGFDSSPGTTVALTVLNSSPTADAGPDRTVAMFSPAALDGTGSSDPDPEDVLGYAWALTSRPPASARVSADIGAATSATASFTPDAPGSYQLTLTVDDGDGGSDTDTMEITATNAAPTAVASAPAQSVLTADVPLDGTASSDPETTVLVYDWTFTSVPAASALTAGDIAPNGSSGASTPRFRPDVRGSYTVALTVDDGFLTSAPSEATVLVVNSPPTAVADGTTPVGRGFPADLDGTGSTDPDGDLLSYTWSFVSQPAASTLTDGDISPNGSTAAGSASFTPGETGAFQVQLAVDDGFGGSDTAPFTVNVFPTVPTARVTAPATVTVTQTVLLDGRASSDPLTSVLIYSWSFASQPAGSLLTAGDIAPNGSTAASTATYSPARKGQYRVRLVVNDGAVDSAPATTATVVVNSPPSAAATVTPTGVTGQTFALSGAGSDPDAEDTLVYSWSFLSQPAGSALTAGDIAPNGTAASATATYPAIFKGTYSLQLLVGDGSTLSTPAVTTALVVNSPPGVAVTVPATGVTGVALTLTATGSDPNGEDTLTYTWSATAAPGGVDPASLTFVPNGSPGAASTQVTPPSSGTYRFRVTVADGDGGSAFAESETAVVAPNRPPSVSIEPSAVVTLIGSAVQLTGTGTDPDPGDVVSYAWTLVSQPAASALTSGDFFPSPAAASIAFTPDVTGPYGIRLVGSDGRLQSAPAFASVTVQAPVNRPPLAVIQAAPLVAGPRTFDLDATASTDPDGDVLSFAWELLAAPAGATPFSSSSAVVQYPASQDGSYTFSLTVRDPQLASDTAQVTLTVIDVPPGADARGPIEIMLSRPDVTVSVPTTLVATLDATASRDDSGRALTYGWEILSAPDLAAGSSGTTTLATFVDAAAPEALVALTGAIRGGSGGPLEAAGFYTFRVTVSDGLFTDTDTVSLLAVDPLQLLPAADAGLDRAVQIRPLGGGLLAPTIPDPTVVPAADAAGNPLNLRDFVRLDGRESADALGRGLTYSWRVLEVPAGSAVTALSGASTAFPTFVPDEEGTYRFELTVSNGLHRSAPDDVEVLVSGTNSPPVAVPVAQDLARLRQSSELAPVLAFLAGDRVVLDATGSADADVADRASLAYRWSQLAGSDQVLAPTTTAAVVSFTPQRTGRLQFRLTVTDPQGASDRRPIEVAVLPAGADPDQLVIDPLTVVATATTTTAAGEDLPEGTFAIPFPPSLRVNFPTTVTLSATTLLETTPAERFDVLWRQVRGPIVTLTNTEDLATTARQSVTRFSPTTSRIHELEVAVFPLESSGARSGLFVTRRIQVVVGTSVPVALATANPVVIPLAGSEAERTITLDGTPSKIPPELAAAGKTLTYFWRQVSGPRGVFTNPFAAITQFVAPLFSNSDPSQRYVFELTVDLFPPGDRSAPFYLAVDQTPAATPPVVPTTPVCDVCPDGKVGGAGCRGGPGAHGGLPSLLALLVPLAAVFRRRRAGSQNRIDQATSSCR